MGTLAAVAPAMMAGSTVLQAGSLIAQNRATQAQAQARAQELGFEQQQLQQNAGQALAWGQRGAIVEQRNTDILASRALAVAGAQGGGAGGTVQTIIARIRGEGTYRAMSSLYEGQTQARALQLEAEGKGFEAANILASAQASKRALPLALAGTVLGGGANIASMFDRYGRPGMPGLPMSQYQGSENPYMTQ